MIETEMHKTIKKIEAWLQTPEGKAHMEEAVSEIRKILEDLKKQETVSIENLQKQMTI